MGLIVTCSSLAAVGKPILSIGLIPLVSFKVVVGNYPPEISLEYTFIHAANSCTPGGWCWGWGKGFFWQLGLEMGFSGIGTVVESEECDQVSG